MRIDKKSTNSVVDSDLLGVYCARDPVVTLYILTGITTII